MTSDFDALCKDYKQGHTDPDRLEEIKRSNKVIRLFTDRYVMENSDELERDGQQFRSMIRAYLNIFDYVTGEKVTLGKVLVELHLEEPLRNNIMTLSKHGRYKSLSRTIVKEYGEQARSTFLDVVEALYNHKNYNDAQLYSKLEMFEEKDVTCRTFGPAFISGLAAALYPQKFSVYNRISVEILDQYGEYEHLARQKNLKNYREFNNLHRKVASRIKRSVIELDATSWD